MVAASRHPRLGIDYSSVSHTFSDAYLNPRSYRIDVNAFPGKILDMPAGDIQQRPGSNPHHVESVWELRVPPGTTGWEFSLTGQPARRLPVGPKPPPVSAKGATRLTTARGVFHEERDDNAWNWHFSVPGPGTYTVTVRTMKGTTPLATRTHTLVLEDLLVVSIGDSAASGQGNPDIAGSPADFDPDISWWEVFVPPLFLFKLTEAAYDWCKNEIKKKLTTLARKYSWTIDMDPAPVWLEPPVWRSLRSGHAGGACLAEERDKGTVITFLRSVAVAQRFLEAHRSTH